MKRFLLFLSLLPLFASAQIPAIKDTTLITPSTPFTPQFRFSNVTLSGVNYRIPQVYNSLLGKYDTYVTTKYLRAFYAPLVGGGYVPTSRTLTINGVTQDLSANRTWTINTTPTQASLTGNNRIALWNSNDSLTVLPQSYFNYNLSGNYFQSFAEWNFLGTTNMGNTHFLLAPTVGDNPIRLQDSTKYVTPTQVSNKYLGELYNKNTFSATTGFTADGITIGAASGHLSITGSGNDFTHSANLTSYGFTMLDNWEETLNFVAPTPSSTTYGAGIGIRSKSSTGSFLASIIGSLDLTNTASKGSLTLAFGASGGDVSTVAPTKLSFSAGDTLQIFISRNVDKITVRAVNITSPQPDVVVTRVFTDFYLLSIHNTGYFAVFSKTATPINVTALRIFSKSYKGQDVAVKGDSKTIGGQASGYYLSTAGLMAQYNSLFNGGGTGDCMQDYINELPELLSLKPTSVLLMGPGRNDIGASVPLDTIKAKIISYVNTVTSAGIPIYITTGWYETSINQSAIRSWLLSMYPTITIDTYPATASSTSSLNADNTHPTDVGYALAYRIISESNKFKNSRDLSGLKTVFQPILSLTSGYIPVSNGASSITNSGVYQASGKYGFNTTTLNGIHNVADGLAGSSDVEEYVMQSNFGVGAKKSISWRDGFNPLGKINLYYDGTYTNMSFGNLYTPSGYGTMDLMRLIGNGGLEVARSIKAGGYTVATLPSSPTVGEMTYVTDALAPTYLVTVVGGGAIVTPVFYNGTNWVCH